MANAGVRSTLPQRLYQSQLHTQAQRPAPVPTRLPALDVRRQVVLCIGMHGLVAHSAAAVASCCPETHNVNNADHTTLQPCSRPQQPSLHRSRPRPAPRFCLGHGRKCAWQPAVLVLGCNGKCQTATGLAASSRLPGLFLEESRYAQRM
jgi:hypothetical protein